MSRGGVANQFIGVIGATGVSVDSLPIRRRDNRRHCIDKYLDTAIANQTARKASPPIIPKVARENESVPIQLAQCWFPGLAVSSAKI